MFVGDCRLRHTVRLNSLQMGPRAIHDDDDSLKHKVLITNGKTSPILI